MKDLITMTNLTFTKQKCNCCIKLKSTKQTKIKNTRKTKVRKYKKNLP